MREPEMRRIAGWIGDVLSRPDDGDLQVRIRNEVRELCRAFPAPTTPE
jgi:glycine/serine hydroxymethyltransferase